MSVDRHSVTQQPELITDEDERARREVANGIRQFNLALEVVRTHVHDESRPFKLRSSLILQLNGVALEGIHLFAGTYRNASVAISGSKHTPVEHFRVAEEVEFLCDYVNENWRAKSAVHLAAYILWRLNWIHPFADGNGRTSRMTSYVVLNIKLDSVLPGAPTIPDQITDDKSPYYDALEKADEAWRDKNEIDVSALEQMLSAMLAQQLVSAAEEATFQPT